MKKPRKIKRLEREIKRDIGEIFTDREFIQDSRHKKLAWTVLLARNISVLAALCLFLLSIFTHGDYIHTLRAAGYFFGAVCYLLELVDMTEFFSRRPPMAEMFMACAFGPLYVLMGISYLTH